MATERPSSTLVDPPAASGDADAVQRVRDGFAAGTTRSLPQRRAHLQALRRLLEEGAPRLHAALRADLGKSPMESQISELSVVLGEISTLQRHLGRWTRPRGRSVPIALQPATASVVREPLGTVLIIAPWNYPAQLALAPLAGALAAGNTAVLKPSELAPATSRALAELVAEFLDPDVVTVVEGGADVAGALLEERWDHIFYTGGARVGRIVAEAAAKHLTPITLELGGKSPVFVDGTGDLAVVADRMVWAKFLNAGQTCVAPDYVLATPDAADRLVPALAAAIRRFFGADPAASAAYGRLIDDRHFDRVAGLIDAAKVAIGGELDRATRYIAPTVLDAVDLDDAVMAEEIFGPVLPIVRVADAATAIEIVNAGEKPLALYVFSTDRRVQHAFLTQTSSGALGINIAVAQLAAPGLPFGGVGMSGLGRYHGEESLRTFSHERAVLRKPRFPDTMRLVYPPYGKAAAFVAKHLLR